MAGHSQRIKHSQELTRPSLEFKLQLAADERTLELQQSALRFLASLLFNLEQTKTKATKKAAGVWSARHVEFHILSRTVSESAMKIVRSRRELRAFIWLIVPLTMLLIHELCGWTDALMAAPPGPPPPEWQVVYNMVMSMTMMAAPFGFLVHYCIARDSYRGGDKATVGAHKQHLSAGIEECQPERERSS